MKSSPAEIARLMRDWYGFDRTVMLDPLVDYRTLHVDMFATFAAPDVVVVGKCDSLVDARSALILDRNAARLAETPVGRHGRMRVHRIPMPSYDGKRCRTYTNVVFANGRLLVPHYSDVEPEVERRVMDVYAELLPDWVVLRFFEARELLGSSFGEHQGCQRSGQERRKVQNK